MYWLERTLIASAAALAVSVGVHEGAAAQNQGQTKPMMEESSASALQQLQHAQKELQQARRRLDRSRDGVGQQVRIEAEQALREARRLLQLALEGGDRQTRKAVGDAERSIQEATRALGQLEQNPQAAAQALEQVEGALYRVGRQIIQSR